MPYQDISYASANRVATVTLKAEVVPGQDNTVEIAPADIHYEEKASDSLFVGMGADSAGIPAIEIFDHYSTLPGGRVLANPSPRRVALQVVSVRGTPNFLVATQ